ncbi:CNH-domain-containing protein [Polyporus arcularius HHB13444]|uniref:CNH-domain-containing protein n=1 Tax=Polyporus arcularius HHB13444 TaxID=1314778 RepID=A0A5C3P6C7_9APHY|nr:CNH-domain-containing protein [Polyporus arcularius HHB13444]
MQWACSVVMTKPKGKGRDVKYVVWKPPVRLEFLQLSSNTIRPVQRSNTFSRMMRSGRDSIDALSSLEQILDSITPNISGSTASSAYYHPLSFYCHGKHGGSYTLYSSTLDERNEWRRKLRDAVAARKNAQAEEGVFRVETITSEIASSQDAPAHQPGLVTGRISCTLPFTSRDGRNLVAIGSEDGVWIGMPDQPESIQRVISLKFVTQIAFLEEHGFFILLADKTLYAIHIESVVHTQGEDTGQPAFGLRKLSGQERHVHFFSAGRQAGRTLVVWKHKKGLDSVFRQLEVLPPSAGLDRFKVYKDFFVPSDSHDLLFLKTKVCILCPRGFEIMDLSDFSSATIPEDEDLRRLGKRPLTSKPLAMFRIREDEFLLCYDEYGLYVDKRGAPSRSPPIIEWEGTASHAAWHPPYVVLFTPAFIEVRHVESGRLAQVINGLDVRCLWDGRGVVRPEGFDDFDDPRTPRIHAVLDDSEMSSYTMAAHARSRSRSQSSSPPKRQHVVVLTPTERLVVPGTRYSPSLLSVADTLPPYVP